MKKQLDEESYEKIKSDLVSSKALIVDAINKTPVEQIKDDKLLDMFANIIYQRLKDFGLLKFYRNNNNPNKSSNNIDQEKKGSHSFIDYFITFGSVILIIAGLISLIYEPKSKATNQNIPNPNDPDAEEAAVLDKNFPKQKDTLNVGSLEFRSAKLIEMERFCGREQEIGIVFKRIINYISELYIHNKQQLDAKYAYLAQNYLFHGPPGTGKTIFFYHIISLVDKELKKLHLSKNDNKFKELLKDESAEGKEKIEQYLAKEPSRVIYIEVSGSSIKSKWLGGAEKAVKQLFESSEELSKREPYTAVFIFFDECDTFFSKRKSNDSENNLSLKNEFLTRIGQSPRAEYVPIFIFGTTNRFDDFDDAFKRRFSHKIEFGLPDYKERVIFIESLLNEYEIDGESKKAIIKAIAILSQGKSHSFIRNEMKNFYELCPETGDVLSLKIKDYISHLKNTRKRNY